MTTRASRAVALLLVLAAVATAAGPVSAASAAPVKRHATVEQMYDLLMCVGCHESLNVAESPQSYAERAQVRQYVAQGLTVKQIENRMVAQYGPAVLAQPPKHGFSLLVYIVPPVVVLAGIALLLYTVPRWRRRTVAARAAAAAGDGPKPALSAEESERLDRELAERP
ncbi:MAG TPA: cytochrome c-type biogenesis protein CcmH [Solirubrobacteraceae bacterium]|nr:cytochrome c-type biogenesis protein CcmH [Solirubrobacteraceae bacterium]